MQRGPRREVRMLKAIKRGRRLEWVSKPELHKCTCRSSLARTSLEEWLCAPSCAPGGVHAGRNLLTCPPV